MSYPLVQIGDLALDEPGSFKIGPFGSSLKKDELVSSGIPVIGIENILPNNFVASYRKFITEKKYQELSQYTVLPGDIAVTTMGTIGRAAVIPEGIGTAIIDSHLFRMRFDKSKVYPPYLCYAINGAPSVMNHLEKMSRGAIMDGLNTTILKESPLALPPLTEQKRIAALLARADRLRSLRRAARALADSLLQSVFLEMFGDIKTNSKNWDMCIIDDVVEFSQYGTSEKSNSEKRGYPVLGMANITYEGKLDLEKLSYVELSDEEFAQLKLERGDVIFNRTNSTELVGKTAYWNYDFDAVIASYLVKLKLKKEMLPEFFVTLLNMPHYKNLFQERCKKAVGQSNISPTLLKEFPVFVPPFPLQEEFARVAARVEGLRARQAEAARQAEELFESLLAQSFG